MTQPGVQNWGIPFRTSAQIRQEFIDFFKKRDHQFVPSSPVVPHGDPTLLFINSGMNQFKSVFLGDNSQGWKRVVNSQKCLRVSGKHNDLDEVGRDTYHHTFFEMLGYWSFGDYYKKDAIKWIWELMTDVWKIPKDRLFASVYSDDDEAEEIWRTETDIEHWRIMRFGAKSNFWEMGDVGPCGPCSELHFDMGDLATQKETYADLALGVNGTNARYIELSNDVFIQYERQSNAELKPLRSKHVDFGAGFERIVSVIQQKGSNYETDLFRPIIDKVAAMTGHAYEQGEGGTPHRVIADHLRALSFAIADGATPGNEGRGYVLRRILRRASRFSQHLEVKEPFIYKLVPTLVDVMGHAFPELKERQDYIAQVIESEESRFMRTLKDGLARFTKIAADLKAKAKDTIEGNDVFTLYDTYGFPADLTGVLAEEAGLRIDQAGFAKSMEEQRERARGAAKFDGSMAGEEGWTLLDPAMKTAFTGYKSLEGPVEVTRYREVGDDILVCLKASPFYAESGGQVGDSGVITGKDLELRVDDTFKILELHVHKCSLVNGLVKKENFTALTAKVDVLARQATVRNHSATHLLHAALKAVLGPHVQQQGSRVGPESLRFDFTQPKALTPEEALRVETLVNQEILQNNPIGTVEMGIDEAKKAGAVALFGEKYGERVRTIKMGGFSYELCGGTHANATGDIGLFKITSESSIASGVRRIEAITGLRALEYVRMQSDILQNMARLFKARPEELPAKVEASQEQLKTYEKELKQLRQEQIDLRIKDLLETGATVVNGITCIVKKIDAAQFPKSSHQSLLDGLAARLNNGVAFLTQVEDGTLSLLAAVGTPARGKIKAGDLVKELSVVADGRGGGRPDRAQAGSKFPEKEPAVLEHARKLIAQLAGG